MACALVVTPPVFCPLVCLLLSHMHTIPMSILCCYRLVLKNAVLWFLPVKPILIGQLTAEEEPSSLDNEACFYKISQLEMILSFAPSLPSYHHFHSIRLKLESDSIEMEIDYRNMDLQAWLVWKQLKVVLFDRRLHVCLGMEKAVWFCSLWFQASICNGVFLFRAWHQV